MLKFFKDCKTIEDVKETYRKLAFLHHPDKGGNIETMKAVNNEYEIAFKQFKNIHRTAAGETYTSKEENTETATDFKDIINSIIHFEGITIEIIGRWIWVTGNTYAYKDKLKELKFTWANTKKAWTWHPLDECKRSHKKFDLNDIRTMFGSEEVKTERSRVLA